MRYYNQIAVLDQGDDFPDPLYGPTDEPVAVGFELTPKLMLRAYARGLFAWSVHPVTWWSPHPRAIFEMDGFYVSRSLRKKMKRAPFRVTLDHDFWGVMQGCALPRRSGERTWVTREFMGAFLTLHAQGYAHSVECWNGAALVGGVFGVALNGFFSAETMFSRATDASKIALYYLLETLRAAGFALFDIQLLTPHTASLGAREISRAAYLRRLKRALTQTPAPLTRREIVAGGI
ncbi:leucyl/phenylalanyl-tRNA--protein transferase [Anaerolineae bacterium CFX7]|nr:leucyl/phenylalanyl-tRNA--protein transferase [Anaerolineae bacterium CFX7]